MSKISEEDFIHSSEEWMNRDRSINNLNPQDVYRFVCNFYDTMYKYFGEIDAIIDANIIHRISTISRTGNLSSHLTKIVKSALDSRGEFLLY